MAGTDTNLLYHLVFSTKNRQGYITPTIEEKLYKYIGGIICGIDGICLEINGISDHVHILAKIPPKIAISNALRDIKANSSKWVNETKSGLRKFGWQDGYSAFTIGKSQVDVVRQSYPRSKDSSS